MATVRTQIYMTRDQRWQLDRLADREGVSLAELIREAVDEYLQARSPDVDAALADCFGAVANATAAQRREWYERRALR